VSENFVNKFYKNYLILKKFNENEKIVEPIQNKTFVGHTSPVTAMTMTIENELVTASGDSTIKIWDVTNANCIKTLAEHKGAVTGLVRDKFSRLVSSSVDGTIKIWDLKTGECKRTIYYTEKEMKLTSLGYSKFAHQIITGDQSGKLCVFDGESGERIKVLNVHEGAITALLVSKAGYLISSAEDEKIKVWKLESGECVNTLVCDEPIKAMVLTKNDRVVSGLQNGEVKVWDPMSGKLVRKLKIRAPITSMALNSDGKLAVATSEKPVEIFKGKDHLRILASETVSASCLYRDKTSRLFCGLLNNEIKQWE
jgi:WD40 repeat protein